MSKAKQPPLTPRAAHVELAKLAKRVIAKQKEYFTCHQRLKAQLLSECRDLERRLVAECDKVIAAEFVTPQLPGLSEGGGK